MGPILTHGQLTLQQNCTQYDENMNFLQWFDIVGCKAIWLIKACIYLKSSLSQQAVEQNQGYNWLNQVYVVCGI